MTTDKATPFKLHSYLTLLALIGRSMLLFPISCLLCFIFLPSLDWYSLIISLSIQICFQVSALLRLGIRKFFPALTTLRQNTYSLIGLVAISLICTSIALFHSLFFTIIICLLCFVAGIFGYLVAFDHFSMTASSKCFFPTIVTNLVAAIAAFLGGTGKDPQAVVTWLTAGIFVFIIIYAICSNQANIDNMMERRGHNMASLPKKVRQYNLILVCILLGLVFAGFIFRKQLIWLISNVFQGIILIISLIIQFFEWLNSIFLGSEQSPSGQNATQEPSMLLDNAADKSFDWVALTFILLLIALIIWKRREIWKLIRGIFSKLLQLITSLIRTAIPALDNQSEPNLGYYDEVERLEGEDTIRHEQRVTKSHSIRLWKKEYRAFLRNDGKNKLFQGYSLLCKGLILSDFPLSASETPYEILNHTCSRITTSAYPKAIKGYVLEQYANVTATKHDLDEMNASLSFLSQLL